MVVVKSYLYLLITVVFTIKYEVSTLTHLCSGTFVELVILYITFVLCNILVICSKTEMFSVLYEYFRREEITKIIMLKKLMKIIMLKKLPYASNFRIKF